MKPKTVMTLPTISNDGQGASYFGQRMIELNGDASRRLSDQIAAVNFRLRRSEDYASDFHVAGDPTLLVVLSGKMRIDLQNGESREFGAGDLYIAEDYLEAGIAFDPARHGHRAQMMGDTPYHALHLKLERRTPS